MDNFFVFQPANFMQLVNTSSFGQLDGQSVNVISEQPVLKANDQIQFCLQILEAFLGKADDVRSLP
jgi:hypothetical protein